MYPARPDAFQTVYPVSEEETDRYRRDGYILPRGVAGTEEITATLPSIDTTLREVTATQDSQGRIEDYSGLFQQVTNVW